MPVSTSYAQLEDRFGQDRPDEDAQLYLQADTLEFNQDTGTVSAIGGVQIEYDGNRLVARKVTYNRNTGRLTAEVNVEAVDPGGNRIYTQLIDVTDDFRDGFIETLRLETTDNTRFAAARAERKDGKITTFYNGVYTACEPCQEKPDKAPIWQIKAKRVIWNSEAETIRFEKSRFELFGFSLFSLPAFEIADHRAKRKTGFLSPSAGYDSELGVFVKVPYYWALSPHYDLTTSVAGYSNQGFLGEAEWRQRLHNGEYSIKVAGISQHDPGEFNILLANGRLRDTADSLVTQRGLVGTKGLFKINPRWSFGWDVLVQSDKNFAHTYSIEGFDDIVNRSQTFLIGRSERNSFELRALHYQYQESVLDSQGSARDPSQPWVLPVLDYSYTVDQPVVGGELNLDVNSRVIYRENNDVDEALLADRTRFGSNLRGLEGTNSRVTAEAEWKRTFIAEGGLALTPLLAARADAISVDLSQDAEAELAFAASEIGVPEVNESSFFRSMLTAGLEARWPVLFSTTSATHILEPIAQVYIRPNESFSDEFGIPNEDAQSFVFDAANLFERDKFSGYDRIEGGSRANIGLRYSAAFKNGWTVNAVAGQSYHLGGVNSFANPDLVNAGASSGLETDRSDFVGSVGIASAKGFSLHSSARFDEKTFDIQRLEVGGTFVGKRLSFNANYAFINEQPLYGFDRDRREITVGAGYKINQNWRVFGRSTYDFVSSRRTRSNLGFAYRDECFDYRMSFSETRDSVGDPDPEYSVNLFIGLRTLGEINTGF